MAEILTAYYGTPNITFDFVGGGPAAGIARHYTSMPAVTAAIQLARIVGGMHFRASTADGETLGRHLAPIATPPVATRISGFATARGPSRCPR